MIPGLVASGAGTIAAFAPTDLAGLKGWYKADGTKWQDSARTTPATADTHPVGAWDDASGLGNHLLQATGVKRPLLKTNIVGALPVLRFDGASGQNLRLATLALTTFSVFLVYKASTAGMFVEHGANAGTSDGHFLYGTVASTIMTRRSATMTDKDLSTNWGINANYRLLTHTFGGTNATHGLRIDRAAASLVPGANPNNPGTGSVTAALNLFARNEASLFVTGDAAELIVVSPVLSDTDRDLVETYLRTKWGTA